MGHWDYQCCLAVSLGLPTCLFHCCLLHFFFVPIVEFLSHVYPIPGLGMSQWLDFIDITVKRTNNDRI